MIAEEFARISPIIWQGCTETFLMVVIALSVATLIGVPLGVVLVVTRPNSFLGDNTALRVVNVVTNTVVNIFRAIPFIILIIWVMPVTRMVAGITYGVRGALFPLILYTTPFIARVTESTLLEVNNGILEAFIALGASPWQIITRVLLRESRAGLVLALTTACVSLIGATAMAGSVGAGGLGDVALRYGYQNYDDIIMNVVVILLIIIVQTVQTFGNTLARRLRK